MLAVLGDVVPRQFASALRCSESAQTQQSTKITVPLPIHRPDNQGRSIDGIEFASDNEGEFCIFCGGMCPNNSSKRIAIGYGQTVVSKFLRSIHQLMSMGRPFEERKIRLAMKFHIACHEKILTYRKDSLNDIA
jgi:hypothetical protein